jgi:hypothetical protein
MVAVNIISRKRLTQSGAPELRLKPEGRLSRLENRLPFLSPAFPGQSTALVVPPPLGADDKAISADDKQYSSALTTPDSKKCPPLLQDWPSANPQAWLGFGLAPQAWLAAASPQTAVNPTHRAHARATARLELMRSALPLNPNPYPAVRGGPCPGDDLRDEVSQFIVQLCDEFELVQWTCYLAISYMDRTLSTLHAQGLTDAQLAKHARDPVLLTVCVRLAAKFADTRLPDPEDMILPRDLCCEQGDRPIDSETLMECYSMVTRQCPGSALAPPWGARLAARGEREHGSTCRPATGSGTLEPATLRRRCRVLGLIGRPPIPHRL